MTNHICRLKRMLESKQALEARVAEALQTNTTLQTLFLRYDKAGDATQCDHLLARNRLLQQRPQLVRSYKSLVENDTIVHLQGQKIVVVGKSVYFGYLLLFF